MLGIAAGIHAMANTNGTETNIIHNKVDTMAADALAPGGARPSAVMILTKQEK